MKNKLTAKEYGETIWVTIGRLRGHLKTTTDIGKERQLALFEKIVKDIENENTGTF